MCVKRVMSLLSRADQYSTNERSLLFHVMMLHMVHASQQGWVEMGSDWHLVKGERGGRNGVLVYAMA